MRVAVVRRIDRSVYTRSLEAHYVGGFFLERRVNGPKPCGDFALVISISKAQHTGTTNPTGELANGADENDHAVQICDEETQHEKEI